MDKKAEDYRKDAVSLLVNYDYQAARMVSNPGEWSKDNTWKQAYYGQRNRLIELIAAGLAMEEAFYDKAD